MSTGSSDMARAPVDSEVFARRAEERVATCSVVAGAVARLQVVEERLAACWNRVGLHHLLHAPQVGRDLRRPFSRARVRADAALEFLSINQQHRDDKVSGRSSAVGLKCAGRLRLHKGGTDR